MRFELTRGNPNGLAVHRLNHSATSSWNLLAEWLRRWTANPLWFPRVSSNLTLVVIISSVKNSEFGYLFLQVCVWILEKKTLACHKATNSLLPVSESFNFCKDRKFLNTNRNKNFGDFKTRWPSGLRRWTANPLGFPRVSSNLIHVVINALVKN